MFEQTYEKTSGPDIASVLSEYSKDALYKSGTYNSGIFTLFDKDYAEKISVEGFRFLIGNDDYVPFGMTALGDLFLLRKKDKEIFILETQLLSFTSPEVTIDGFFNNFLVNKGVIEDVLNRDYANSIYSHLQKLPEYPKCYIPQPYLFLGGKDIPSNYILGDFAVYMELVSQTLLQNPSLMVRGNTDE
ncbi:MAG: DUF1851 domain-containing protein [Gammaproteobacteria bacterium]|nr:DUF1851 domain-containing protein [Gammaproteobacteria bacterium]